MDETSLPSSSGLTRGSTETLIADLEKQIMDLRHDLASARHVSKNALANCDYWKAQYDAFAAADPRVKPEDDGVDLARLLVGIPVNKVLGYPFPGKIVAAFHTLSGQERFVVEATGADYRGMLHIFNGDQLRVATSTPEPTP